jgi:tellurite methyltransferase
MQRSIESFHEDEHGDWVATLSCGHSQHMRHKPPMVTRPWVLTAEGRAARIGQPIECVLCDRG